MLLPGAVAPIRKRGLGVFSVLPDTLLVDILGRLPGSVLGMLATTSRAMYAYVCEEEVWKEVTLSAYGEDAGEGGFMFVGDWRRTWIAASLGLGLEVDPESGVAVASDPSRAGLALENWSASLGPWEGLYSDYLYQGFVGSVLDLEMFDRDENIDRVHASALSVEEFIEVYDKGNKPVIIEGAIDHWPALGSSLWTREALMERHPEVAMAAGRVNLTFEQYFAYARATGDESPIYLFDKQFGEKDPGLVEEYDVPPYFATADYFSELPPEVRPRFRWFLIGPQRSGSSFHKDPNFTSAWNGLVSGCKRWILYPPNYTPPGVHPSRDGWSVTTPLSLASWFLNFYDEARDPESVVKPTLAVQKPGDVIFIPSQHWHTALNLEESVAVTQNYVSDANLPEVLDFLSRKEDTTLYHALKSHVDSAHPELLDTIKAERRATGWSDTHYFPMPTRISQVEGEGEEGGGWWDSISEAASESREGGGFSFGF